jgi:dCMP deaminase
MSMAHLTSMRSIDASTRIGCVIAGKDNVVKSIGYNGPCRGIEFSPDDERQQRPQKYFWFEHAERNAVFNATREGVPLHGAICYVTALPCADCCRALIQSGISEIVFDETITKLMSSSSSDWEESHSVTLRMLSEAGLVLTPYSQGIVEPCGLVRGREVELS